MSNRLTMNAWKWACGLPEEDNPPTLDLKALYESEWSEEFENLMRNRLVLGAIRYGRLADTNRRRYDRIGNMIERLKIYQETGNDELLIDVANLALVEFAVGDHPNKHFNALDDVDFHAKEIIK